MMDKSHSCSKEECTCHHVLELTYLYRDLKARRKKMKRVRSDGNIGFRTSQAEIEMFEREVAPICNRKLKEQREQLQTLMSKLPELSEKLALWEEEICESDKLLTELQNEMCEIKRKYEMGRRREEKKHQSEKVDANWRNAVTCEIEEQNRLQKKLKKFCEYLEMQKWQQQCKEEKEKDSKKLDTELLLDALKCIEKSIEQSKIMMCRK